MLPDKERLKLERLCLDIYCARHASDLRELPRSTDFKLAILHHILHDEYPSLLQKCLRITPSDF